jgi:hypothetical protein
MKRKNFFLFLIFITPLAHSQTRLILNGGNIVMQNGAYLVVPDGSPNAIASYNVLGGFIMNDATSRIRWHIGTTSAFYQIPYFYAGTFIPFSFATSGAVGAGYFDLGTYATPTWKNSDYLPPGVTNVNNNNGTDNSSRIIDRFWSLSAENYTTKPSLSNLIFSYRDAEWNAPGNIINEALLKAQRWNNSLGTWTDFAPAGTTNAVTNQFTMPSISSANLFQWWTLVDVSFPLPLQLLSFKGYLEEKKVKLDWTTTSEVNTKEFVVQRSVDRVNYTPVDTVGAAGNSTTQKNYSAFDLQPLQGVSYYRLKMIDIDGRFSYSHVAMIVISGEPVMVYPNPATDRITVNLGETKANSFIIFEVSGRAVRTGSVSDRIFSIEISNLAQGSYLLQLATGSGVENFTFIKQ